MDLRPGERLATRTTLRNRGEPSGFGRIAAPLLMTTAMRRKNRKALARLNAIPERAGSGSS